MLSGRGAEVVKLRQKRCKSRPRTTAIASGLCAACSVTHSWGRPFIGSRVGLQAERLHPCGPVFVTGRDIQNERAVANVDIPRELRRNVFVVAHQSTEWLSRSALLPLTGRTLRNQPGRPQVDWDAIPAPRLATRLSRLQCNPLPIRLEPYGIYQLSGNTYKDLAWGFQNA